MSVSMNGSLCAANPNFGAQLMHLPEIFNERLFVVPDYQRGYAWGKKQVEELLKDINHLMSEANDSPDEKTPSHYTGTLVLSRSDTILNGTYHVVDGQQRLTTLVVLMKMLNELLPAAERTDFTALYIRRGEVGSDNAVLTLNSDTRVFFENVVLGDGNVANEPVTLEAHERLLESRKIIGKWLTDHVNEGATIAGIRNVIETQLGFLVYAPKEDAETGIMFEVINNRGKQLSELEKVKNFLIYCCVKLKATTLRKSIDTDWSSILRNLNTAKKTSQSDEDAFLRYCVAVYFKLNKTDSQYGYDELKKLIVIDSAVRTETIGKISNFVSFLKSSALWYSRLYGQQHHGLEPQLIPIFNQLRAQGQQASIMPIFLALVIKNEGKGDRLVSLLKLLEILNFRVYMTRNMTSRNDTGQADLYKFASRYYHSELKIDFSAEAKQFGYESIDSEEAALEYRLVGFVLWHAADERFKSSFVLESGSPNDFYHWDGLRYFLMNYEAVLEEKRTIPIEKILLSRQEGKSADYLSVEHLWAVENRNKIGENDRREDKFEKRRLGNFVLLELRLNIQGGNDGLELKLPKYLKSPTSTHLAQVKMMAMDAEKVLVEMAQRTKHKNYYSDFHQKVNSLQEQRFIDFAEKRWSIKPFLGYKQLFNEVAISDNEVGS